MATTNITCIPCTTSVPSVDKTSPVEIAKEVLGAVMIVIHVTKAIPQIYKMIKKKTAYGISLWFWILILVGAVISCAYGVLADEWPYITRAVLVFAQALLIIGLYKHYQRLNSRTGKARDEQIRMIKDEMDKLQRELDEVMADKDPTTEVEVIVDTDCSEDSDIENT